MLAVATFIAIILVLLFPLPDSVRKYFHAQLLYIPPVFLTAWLIGPGRFYDTIYTFFTAVILVKVLGIVWKSMYSLKSRLGPAVIALILALGFVRLAYSGLDRPVAYTDWIVLSEGFLLLFSGILTAYTARLRESTDIVLGLSFLWLAQAGFDFVYCLQLHWPGWERLDWIVPPITMIMACLYIGYRASLGKVYSHS